MTAERFEFAKELAQRAGVILRQGYGRVQQVEHKGSIDLVTEFDLRSEAMIVAAIEEHFPQDSIHAEESGERGDGRQRWIIDPLDGTTNFAHAIPHFCISIAWAEEQKPTFGIIYEPLRDELFAAYEGLGAWLNDTAIAVSPTAQLSESLLVTGFPYDVQTNPVNNLDAYAAFALRTRGVRRLGSAALDLAYVACGRFDGYWERRLWPWDWAAGMLLVEQAGGTISRVEGDAEIFAVPTSLLASNGRIHQAMVELLGSLPGSR